MKRFTIVEKIMIVIIALGVAWMSVKCAHDIGYRNGIMANQTQAEKDIQNADEMLEACERAIDAAATKCDERVEAARIEGENAVLEYF